jgi:hypothetical protein
MASSVIQTSNTTTCLCFFSASFSFPDHVYLNLIVPSAPRFGHIQGALPETLPLEALLYASHREALHSCFGQRILYGHPDSGRYHPLMCITDLCPDNEPPAVSIYLIWDQYSDHL